MNFNSILLKDLKNLSGSANPDKPPRFAPGRSYGQGVLLLMHSYNQHISQFSREGTLCFVVEVVYIHIPYTPNVFRKEVFRMTPYTSCIGEWMLYANGRKLISVAECKMTWPQHVLGKLKLYNSGQAISLIILIKSMISPFCIWT
jgi:hypothetical protein